MGKMNGIHTYELALEWTGNKGSGTNGYSAYSRDHEIRSAGKPPIAGSADPEFRGDAHSWNPEELLVSSLSQCHMLWFLHLASSAGVIVTAYLDNPIGSMFENADGSGQFTEVLLRPSVTVTEAAMVERATNLHHEAEEMCFIARSVNFPVRHEPVTLMEGN